MAAGTAQQADKTRASIRRKMWRRSDGSNALEYKNVGASFYAKAQRQLVKIWGLPGNGHLECFLLAQMVDIKGRKRSANMNGDRYEQVVKRSFKAWRKKMFPRAGFAKLTLVKDFEVFLRQPRNLEAEENAILKTLPAIQRSHTQSRAFGVSCRIACCLRRHWKWNRVQTSSSACDGL